MTNVLVYEDKHESFLQYLLHETVTILNRKNKPFAGHGIYFLYVVWQKAEANIHIICHFNLIISSSTKHVTWSPFYLPGLTLIITWISNRIPSKVRFEISHPFPSFNGCTVEVLEWISIFISHLVMALAAIDWGGFSSSTLACSQTPATHMKIFHQYVPLVWSSNELQWLDLTQWGRDKMVAIFQMTYSNAFSWTKMCEFRLKFHWSLFPVVQLIASQHWFR